MKALDLSGLDPCVHCGFCLQSCPTYLVTGDESDSPRGRIVLMREVASNNLKPLDHGVLHHLDRCLGCRACEPVCPSGVEYGSALEETRALQSSLRQPSLVLRGTLALLSERRLRRPVLALGRALRPLLTRLPRYLDRFPLRPVAATSPARLRKRIAEGASIQESDSETAAAAPKASAALFRGCIMDDLLGHVHDATRRTLRVVGSEVGEVSGQVCCGALHAHAGLSERARALAEINVRAFDPDSDDPIVVNSAGCGAMLREYPRILRDHPLEKVAERFAARVREVTVLLAESGPPAGARLDLRVAYDPPCHLVHAQRIAEAPRTVLECIPGLRLLSHPEAELCCGSAGTYSLTQPILSGRVTKRKVQALQSVQPDVVATGNPGCIMQLGGLIRVDGRSVPVVHPVELLDHSYQLAGYYSSH